MVGLCRDPGHSLLRDGGKPDLQAMTYLMVWICVASGSNLIGVPAAGWVGLWRFRPRGDANHDSEVAAVMTDIPLVHRGRGNRRGRRGCHSG